MREFFNYGRTLLVSRLQLSSGAAQCCTLRAQPVLCWRTTEHAADTQLSRSGMQAQHLPTLRATWHKNNFTSIILLL